jgi:hypothetical protein
VGAVEGKGIGAVAGKGVGTVQRLEIGRGVMPNRIVLSAPLYSNHFSR